MYQLEVKRWLVAHCYPKILGWQVYVDVDSMERANGGPRNPDKSARARVAELALIEAGARIGAHPRFGRVDIVAEHPTDGLVIAEVEGRSSKQKEQAVYSALGQLLLQMNGHPATYVIATPDDPSWERQLRKIPSHVLGILDLRCVLVSEAGVRTPED